MLDKTTVREIAKTYAKEVKKILDPSAILVFGSYINGNPHEYSDIDIAVIVNDFKGDWLETGVMLCRLSRQVSFDIEPHLLDIAKDKSGFVEYILKTGEFIYRAA